MNSKEINALASDVNKINRLYFEEEVIKKPATSSEKVQEHLIEAYIDGSCLVHSSCAGGWGVVLLVNEEEAGSFSGSVPETTNNRMELQAAIEALKKIKKGTTVTVYSDSAYVILGITNWIHNWRTKAKKYKNEDLWNELYNLTFNKGINVIWKHVNGHAGDKWNDKADKLACTASASIDRV